MDKKLCTLKGIAHAYAADNHEREEFSSWMIRRGNSPGTMVVPVARAGILWNISLRISKHDRNGGKAFRSVPSAKSSACTTLKVFASAFVNAIQQEVPAPWWWGSLFAKLTDGWRWCAKCCISTLSTEFSRTTNDQLKRWLTGGPCHHFPNR